MPITKRATFRTTCSSSSRATWTAEEVHAQLAALFGDASAAALPPVFIPAEPPQLGRRESHERLRHGTHAAPSRLARARRYSHPDIPALDVLAVVARQRPQLAALQTSAGRAGIVHSIDAWCYAPGQADFSGRRDPRSRQTRARRVGDSSQSSPSCATAALLPAELDKAKRITLAQPAAQRLTTMRGKASDLGSNWLITRNLNFSRDYLAPSSASPAPISVASSPPISTIAISPSPRSIPPARSHARMRCRSAAAISAKEIEKFELANGLRLLVREDCRACRSSRSRVAFKAGLLAETMRENNGITRLLAKVLLKGTKPRTGEQTRRRNRGRRRQHLQRRRQQQSTSRSRVMQPDLRLGLERARRYVLCNAIAARKSDRSRKGDPARRDQGRGGRDDRHRAASFARTALRGTSLWPAPSRHAGIGRAAHAATISLAFPRPPSCRAERRDSPCSATSAPPKCTRLSRKS